MAMNQAIQHDLILLAGALVLAILGLYSVFFKAAYLSYPTIVVTDLYLFLVLLFAAIRSDAKPDGICVSSKCLKQIFPSKTAGVFIIAFLLTALISGFAGLYLNTTLSQALESPLDALYFCSVTMMTVGFGDYVPLGEGAKLLVMGQLVSGMLLLFGVFPLLISRLSTF
jgi:ion channel